MKSFYYISTGRKGVMYTIRNYHEYLKEPWRGDRSDVGESDTYVCSLGDTWEAAKVNLAKWEAIAGVKVDLQGDPASWNMMDRKEGRAHQCCTMMQWGQHKGTSLYTLKHEHTDYVKWLLGCNIGSRDFRDTLEHICMDIIHDMALTDNQRYDEKFMSDHVGQVGEKITVSAVVIFTKSIDTQYGTSRLILFKSGHNILKAFYSGSNEFYKGDELTLTGTVKDHDVYDGQKNTMLTRIKRV